VRGAQGFEDNRFKIDMAQRATVSALRRAGEMA